MESWHKGNIFSFYSEKKNFYSKRAVEKTKNSPCHKGRSCTVFCYRFTKCHWGRTSSRSIYEAGADSPQVTGRNSRNMTAHTPM